MAFRTQKISQMTPKGADLEATDLIEVSTIESGSYVTRSITGQEIIDAAAAAGGVTSVGATAPIASSGGTTPTISIATANTTTTGALTSTDWNTFNNKQSALTLTTTGTSGAATLVGATLNIPQYGGGGLQGIHNVNGYFDLTSQGISAQLNSSTSSNVGTSSNTMYAYPFIPNKTITSVSLKINVSVLGAGVNARILIYSSVNGAPTTKIYESADLDCSTTGIKTATTAQTFTAGTTYWLCVQTSGTCSLSGIQPSSLLPLAMSSSLSAAPTVAYINTSTFGSAPTTFVINNRSNSAVPTVGIYLS